MTPPAGTPAGGDVWYALLVCNFFDGSNVNNSGW